MPTRSIEHNPLLFGRDERPGIVAVESVGPFIRIFFRTAGRVHFHDEPFQPFILVNDPGLLSGCKVPCAVRQLAGDDFFRCQLLFDSWNHCLTARDFLAAKTGKNYSYVLRQVISLLFGLAAMFVAYKIDYRFWKKNSLWMMMVLIQPSVELELKIISVALMILIQKQRMRLVLQKRITQNFPPLIPAYTR